MTADPETAKIIEARNLSPSFGSTPAANVPASGLDRLDVDAINVATDGSGPAIEQVRTGA